MELKKFTFMKFDCSFDPRFTLSGSSPQYAQDRSKAENPDLNPRNPWLNPRRSLVEKYLEGAILLVRLFNEVQ